MVRTLLASFLFGRCLVLVSSAPDLYGEPPTTVDFFTEATASSAGHPLFLLQTKATKVLIGSPENATNSSQESPATMADFYQQTSSKAAALAMGAPVQNLPWAGILRYPRAERSMADVYQEAFQAESERNQRIEIHPASPSMLRVAQWIGGLMLASLATFTLFVVALGWVPGTRMHKLVARPVPSRLLGQCVDINVVPPGTVCAVCLEDASETCDKKSSLEGSAEDVEDVDQACEERNKFRGPADDVVKPLDQPALEGPADADPQQLDQKSLQAKLLTVSPCDWCRTPCGHCFHRECLEKWLASAEKKRCPLCNWQ